MLQQAKNTVEKAVYTIEHYVQLEQFIAALLVMIPLILSWADTEVDGLRTSISAYVRMPNSYWFGSLVALAGAMFIFNGALHMKGQKQEIALDLNFNPNEKVGKGYNLIFGFSLFGVIYFDYIIHCWTHHICAGIFFVGCALTMVLNKDRNWMYRIGMFLATIVPLAAFFTSWFDGFTLLHAEWIGLVFIAIHFIFESIKNGNTNLEKVRNQ